MSDEYVRPKFAIDRDLQLHLLRMMREDYPERANVGRTQEEWLPAIGQLAYLEDQGLCDAGLVEHTGGFDSNGARITAKGLDFLEDDGGLSAILGVVTVKLHADTIRDLLIAKVDESALPPEKKSAIKEHLKKLPAAALQVATTDLVKTGLQHLPDATLWLGKLVGLG